MAIVNHTMGPVRTSLRRVPSVLPIVTTLTYSVRNRDSFIGNTHLHLGRSSHLRTITGLIESLNNAIHRSNSSLCVVNDNVLGKKRNSYIGSRHLIVTNALVTLVDRGPMALGSDRTVAGSCPSFFRS